MRCLAGTVKCLRFTPAIVLLGLWLSAAAWVLVGRAHPDNPARALKQLSLGDLRAMRSKCNQFCVTLL